MPTTVHLDARLIPALQRLAATFDESVSDTANRLLTIAVDALELEPVENALPSNPEDGADTPLDLLDAILIAGQGVCRSSIR